MRNECYGLCLFNGAYNSTPQIVLLNILFGALLNRQCLVKYIPLSVLYFIGQCLLIRHGPFLSFFEDKGHSNCAVWTRYFIGGALVTYNHSGEVNALCETFRVCYWCGVYK